MFSLHARARFVERGWSAGSIAGFVADSLRESRDEMRARPDLVSRMVRFAVLFAVFLGVTLPLFYLPRPGRDALLCVTLAMAGVVGFTAWCLLSVGLMRRSDGPPVAGPGAANYLTLARFYLIAPVVVTLLQGRLVAALSLYLVLGVTDVADGIVARRRDEKTEFGVVMDPLADVFSTAAIFAALWVSGYVPGWLLAILAVRYAMLIAGSFVFFLLIGPLRFRATAPGKIVGVLQAAGVSALVVVIVAAPGRLAALGTWLFPFLGLCFASIVLSQAAIALRERQRLRRIPEKVATSGS